MQLGSLSREWVTEKETEQEFIGTLQPLGVTAASCEGKVSHSMHTEQVSGPPHLGKIMNCPENRSWSITHGGDFCQIPHNKLPEYEKHYVLFTDVS